MELNHLRTFYEVARLGSFTKASKSLRVSQPSISKTVRLLEERVEARLLDRGRRSVTLTQTGRRFFEACETIFREVDTLANYLETSREECTGDLLLGASDNLCNYVLPRLLLDFGQEHPKVTTRLFSGTSEDIKATLVNGRCDLGIFYTPVTEPAFETEKLGFVEFWLVTAPSNASKDLEDLLCVGSRVVDYTRPYPALRLLESIGIRPTQFFETNNQETQKRMVLEGLGYTLVPRHMVSAEVKCGALKRLKTSKKVGCDLILCRKRSRALPKPALLFTDALRAHLRSSHRE